MAKVQHEHGLRPHDAIAHVVTNDGETIKSYRRKDYGKDYKDMAKRHAHDLKEEELQEVSKGLLKKYGPAAMKSAENLEHKSDRQSAEGDKIGAIKTATKAQIRKNYVKAAAGKISPSTLDGYGRSKIDGYNKHFPPSGKNFKGFADQAIRRSGLKEEEQLDEVSRKTLFSYMNKARPDEYSHEVAATNYGKMAHKGMKYAATAEKVHGKKLMNRYHGLGRAGSKLQGGEYIDHHGNGHRARIAANEEKSGFPLSVVLAEMKRQRGRPKKKRDMLGHTIDDDEEEKLKKQ